MEQKQNTAFLVLAGGKGRRLAGLVPGALPGDRTDKALVRCGNRSLIEHVLDRICAQASPGAISANGPAARFASFGLPVLPDPVADQPGPLAGILAGLEWLAHQQKAGWMVVVPCDTPILPRDLVLRLHTARIRDNADMVIAVSSGRDHPVVGLFHTGQRVSLRDALTRRKIRKVDMWMEGWRVGRADFGSDPIDPFFNINDPGDIERITAMLHDPKSDCAGARE